MTTKQYLRFCPGSVFGIVASPTAKILQLTINSKTNYAAVPACEDVLLWNLQTKEKIMVLKGNDSFVSCTVIDFNYRNMAVGYGDGMVRIFNVRSGERVSSFCGHKSAVSCLAFEDDGSNLASGGKDSEIVIWNITDQAGVFRLKGHKGPISKCHFVKSRNILISSSRDTYIKFWDLDTQHCFQTLVGNRNEILDFITIKGTRLITGINGPDLKVWDLFYTKNVSENGSCVKKPRLDIQNNEEEHLNSAIAEDQRINENESEEDIIKYSEVGKLLTAGDKTVSLGIDKTERVLGCHASTKILQLYKILNSEEATKRFRKRRRKEINKKEENTFTDEPALSLMDEFESLKNIHLSGKIDSFSITVQNNDAAKIAVLLKNNSILQYEFDIKLKNSEAQLCHSIMHPGHRTVIRTLSYSADNTSILSGSHESIKIWKSFKEEQTCTHTIDCDSPLCSVFITGNNHCVIGTKNGKLEIFDINARDAIQSIESHEGAVNAVSLSPDQCGIASGGKDKDVKFWDFELIEDEHHSTAKKKLSLALKRTLKMPEEVVCLVFSPDNKRIAIALLDSTVQVLFVDSLKLAFSLYGHVLPVTCMDISYDGLLIATGSEDKDIRIWSMEFGSCNKFIKRAHDKGITCLRFLPKTHLFFTGGRDYAVKQWDADIFQKIITLKGHQGEVTSMTVSPDGITVVTAAKDKSVRIWEKTREPLVLEEEQEKEREEDNEVEDLPVVPGEVNKEVALAGLKSAETIKTVDQLIEAIDVYKEEILKLEEHEKECRVTGKRLPPPVAHPLLRAFSTTSPIRYIEKVIKRVKSSELEGTLLYLPFNYVLDFLKILCEFADKGWETELCERCASFLIRIHFGQIVSARNFHPVIERLREKLFTQVYHMKDMIGFAKIVCQLQQRAIDAREEVPVFTNILSSLQQKKKKSKKKLERSVINIS